MYFFLHVSFVHISNTLKCFSKIHTHCRRLCKATEIFVRMKSMFYIFIERKVEREREREGQSEEGRESNRVEKSYIFE